MRDLSTEVKSEFLRNAIQSALARVHLLSVQIQEVDVSLKYGMCSPEIAVGWLDEIGALPFVNREIAAMPDDAEATA